MHAGTGFAFCKESLYVLNRTNWHQNNASPLVPYAPFCSREVSFVALTNRKTLCNAGYFKRLYNGYDQGFGAKAAFLFRFTSRVTRPVTRGAARNFATCKIFLPPWKKCVGH